MTSAVVANFLDLLQGVHPTGSSSWSAKCPAHEDSSPSLSVKVGDDGRVLVKCHAGCSAKAPVGLKRPGLFQPATGDPLGPLVPQSRLRGTGLRRMPGKRGALLNPAVAE